MEKKGRHNVSSDRDRYSIESGSGDTDTDTNTGCCSSWPIKIKVSCHCRCQNCDHTLLAHCSCSVWLMRFISPGHPIHPDPRKTPSAENNENIDNNATRVSLSLVGSWCQRKVWKINEAKPYVRGMPARWSYLSRQRERAPFCLPGTGRADADLSGSGSLFLDS